MSKLLPIFSMFIVFSFISYLLGKKLLDYVNIKCDVLALPFGYFAYFAIFQILVYPIQLLKLNTLFLPVVIVLISLSVLLSCFGKIKNIKLNKFAIIYTLVVFTLFLLIYYNKLELLQGNITFNDALFYDNQINLYSRSNVMLNTLDPVSGNTIESLSVIYALLGGSNFLSGLSILTNIEPLLITNWFFPMLYCTLMTTCAYNIYKLVNKYFNNNKMALALLATETILILSSNSILYSSYITSIRQYSVFSFCLLLLILYIKTKEKPFIYWFIITNIALISFHSTQVFLIGFYLFSFVVYQVISKDVDIKATILLAIPDFIYVFFYILYEYLTFYTLLILLIFVLMIFILYKKNIKMNNRFLLILIIALAILINASYFYLGNQIATYDGYSTLEVFKGLFCSPSLITVIYYLYTALAIYSLFRFKELDVTSKFVSINAITILVFFFNPLSASFVSKYILSIVYERTFNIYFDMIFFAILLFNTQFHKKTILVIQTVAIVVFSLHFLVLGVNSAKIAYTELNKKQTIINEIDPIYKVGYESMQLGYALDSYIDVFNVEGNITFPRFVINTILISNKYHFSNLMQNFGELRTSILTFDSNEYDEMNDKTKIEIMLEDPSLYFSDWYYTNEPDKVPDFKSIILDSNTDFFVMKKREFLSGTYYRFDEILSSFATLVAGSDNYDIYYIPR